MAHVFYIEVLLGQLYNSLGDNYDYDYDKMDYLLVNRKFKIQ